MPALPWIILGLAWPIALTGPPRPGTSACLAVMALAVFALRGLRPDSGQSCTACAAAWRASRRTTQRPCRHRRTRPHLWHGLPLILALAAWAGWQVERGLELRLTQPFSESRISGQIRSLPRLRDGLTTFRFAAERGPWGAGSRLLEVRWFDADAVPRVGERWTYPLRLLPPRGRLNFNGGDAERFWFGDGVHGIATVKGDGARRLAAARGAPVQRLRAALSLRLDERLDGLPGNGLVRALAIGERSGLSAEVQEAMRSTGTGHLLAISGLHVGLVALFVTGLARGVLLLVGWRSLRWPAKRVAPFAGLSAAFAYAGLAGFGTSPRRAVVMLAVLVIVLGLRRRPGPWRAWAVALAAVLVLDPLAPLQAGFWLSFGAVAVLIGLFAGHRPRPTGAAAFLRAQGGLMLALYPAGLAWFGAVSLGALPANALAIPWVGFVTLPLVLASLPAAGFDGAWTDVLISMAGRSAALLETGLTWAAGALEPGVVAAAPPRRLALGLATVGAGLCLLPPRLGVWRVGGLLALALLLPGAPRDHGVLQVDVLDVGQGQATLVRTAQHVALVDVGPGMPGVWDRVASVIGPALGAWRASGPDLVILSHADLDHAGGLAGVRQSWPSVSVMGNQRAASPGLPPCHSRRGWAWDGVRFQVLHPSPYLPYRGNDSSCVLELVAAGGNVLLPGDVGRLVEQRLVRSGSGDYRLLLAPHHGSRSSSSNDFLRWAQPDYAVFSTGYANRFHMPHPEVRERYGRFGIPTGATAGCGGMRFLLHADGRLDVRSARRERRGFWRFSAAPGCPGAVPARR